MSHSVVLVNPDSFVAAHPAITTAAPCLAGPDAAPGAAMFEATELARLWGTVETPCPCGSGTS